MLTEQAGICSIPEAGELIAGAGRAAAAGGAGSGGAGRGTGGLATPAVGTGDAGMGKDRAVGVGEGKGPDVPVGGTGTGSAVSAASGTAGVAMTTAVPPGGLSLSGERACPCGVALEHERTRALRTQPNVSQRGPIKFGLPGVMEVFYPVSLRGDRAR